MKAQLTAFYWGGRGPSVTIFGLMIRYSSSYKRFPNMGSLLPSIFNTVSFDNINSRTPSSGLSGWRLVRLFAAVLFVVGVVRTAWVTEDAFITFRTVENFFNGFGLRWNVGERVQTYSHPLWMMALCVGRAVTGELYYSSLILGGLCSALAVYAMAFRLANSIQAGACVLLVLAFTKSFVDYSTSGLEGPLTHLLLATFALLHFGDLPARRKLLLMTLVASLGAVNRADTALLYLPTVLIACRAMALKDCIKPILIGSLPLVAWIVFATLYYGTPIPIAGFAKGMTGIAPSEMFAQGLKFYADVATRDPVLLPAMCLGLLVALFNRHLKGFGLALGALLYCAYLLKIGGGYMAGRFLTPPFFLAMILLVRVPWSARARFFYPASLAATLVLGFLCTTTPILSGADFTTRHLFDNTTGILDERGSWYQRTGLLATRRDIPEPNALPGMLGRDLNPAKPMVFQDGLVGLDGYLAGPGVHFVDQILCDPLLMRLPADKREPGEWKVGHYYRTIPDGYLESVAFGTNKFAHPGLSRAYDDVRQLTRADIFSIPRFKAMWSLAFGEGKLGLRAYAQAGNKHVVVETKSSDFPETCAEGAYLWNEEFSMVPSGGLVVSLGELSHANQLNIGLGGLAEYKVIFLCAGKDLGSIEFFSGRRSSLFPGILPNAVPVPEQAAMTGFDAVRIEGLSVRRTGQYCVAYVEVD